VAQIPGQAGGYRLEMRLLPHYQLDALSASLRLVHRLPNNT
jgi:predicted component of type VI protein secretion system